MGGGGGVGGEAGGGGGGGVTPKGGGQACICRGTLKRGAEGQEHRATDHPDKNREAGETAKRTSVRYRVGNLMADRHGGGGKRAGHP